MSSIEHMCDTSQNQPVKNNNFSTLNETNSRKKRLQHRTANNCHSQSVVSLPVCWKSHYTAIHHKC